SIHYTPAAPPPGDGVDLEYRRLFSSFGQGADGHISRKDLFSKLHQCGILVDDPRIQETVRSLRALDEPDKITFAQFKQISRRSEEHTSELQSLTNLVCRLLLEKKKKNTNNKYGQDTYRSHDYPEIQICYRRVLYLQH